MYGNSYGSNRHGNDPRVYKVGAQAVTSVVSKLLWLLAWAFLTVPVTFLFIVALALRQVLDEN